MEIAYKTTPEYVAGASLIASDRDQRIMVKPLL
ncbi:hypothetical protein AF72_06815 [Xylella taiwanensis]|uniref:Uncharacterized protein n=1 Tax=Xylella taiwanensis TaxID=1444770 RepID=Z9JJ57_9GAMM|nr:hypothetical protein AF72_06815 [Xylella taiwanensis]